MATPSNPSEPRINRDTDAWKALQAEVDARQAALIGPPRPNTKAAPVWQPDRRKREFKPEYGNCPVHGQYQINKLVDGRECFMPDVCQVCERQRRTRKLFAQAEIPPRFESCTFENYEAAGQAQLLVLGQCQDYADHFPEYLQRGTCLILMGNVGTGKNHLSTAIVRAVLEQGYSALRVKASNFLNTFWAKDFGERDKWVAEIARIDLLMIDELGRTSVEKGANDAFFALLDARYDQGKPTMLITNLDKDGIVKAITEAGYDRLTQGGGRLLKFTWDSYRRKAGAA